MANAPPRPTGVGSKRPRAEVLVPNERDGDGGQHPFAAYGAPHMSSHPMRQQAAAMGGGVPALSGPHMMQDGSGRGGMVMAFPPHYTAPGLHLVMPDGAILDHHGVHPHMLPGPPRMAAMPPHAIPGPAGKGRANGGRPNSPPRPMQLQGGVPPPLYVTAPPGPDKARPMPAKLMPGVHMPSPNEYEMLVNGLGGVPMVPGAAQGGPGLPTDGAMMSGKAPNGTLRPMPPPPAQLRQMMNVGQIPPPHGFATFTAQPVLPGPGPGANATSIALHHQLESQLKQAIVQGQPVQHLKLLIEDHMRQEEKKHKKRAANRRSASSSRARKKKYIEKLTSENRRLKRISRILAILPDLVMVVNEECRITFASWRSQKMLQYDDVLMGKSIFEVAVPDCHERIKAAVQATLLHSQLLKSDEAEGGGSAAQGFPILDLNVKSEGPQEAALVTSGSSSSPSIPGSIYTPQSSMASSTPATSADTRTSGSSAAPPATATGMPSSGGPNGISHSDCHHSSGGINSQRQCAQQASLITGLKDFRNRKNQVCLTRQDGSSMWCTMRASLFLRPVNSRENEDKDSDNDDESVSSSNHEGGGSLAMHGSTQPEVILSFRPVDREMHPVNNKQARQEGETNRRQAAVDPKRQHGAACMSGPPTNGKKVSSSGSSSGSNGTTTQGGNSTSSSGRSGSSGALPAGGGEGGGANRGAPPVEQPNGNGHVLHGSERAPVWNHGHQSGNGKAKDVAGNGSAATSTTTVGMVPVGNSSSNSNRAQKKAKVEGSVEKGATQEEGEGGEDHRAIELEAARSLVRIMNSS